VLKINTRNPAKWQNIPKSIKSENFHLDTWRLLDMRIPCGFEDAHQGTQWIFSCKLPTLHIPCPEFSAFDNFANNLTI
jgi:hypothetical protein